MKQELGRKGHLVFKDQKRGQVPMKLWGRDMVWEETRAVSNQLVCVPVSHKWAWFYSKNAGKLQNALKHRQHLFRCFKNWHFVKFHFGCQSNWEGARKSLEGRGSNSCKIWGHWHCRSLQWRWREANRLEISLEVKQTALKDTRSLEWGRMKNQRRFWSF